MLEEKIIVTIVTLGNKLHKSVCGYYLRGDDDGDVGVTILMTHRHPIVTPASNQLTPRPSTCDSGNVGKGAMAKNKIRQGVPPTSCTQDWIYEYPSQPRGSPLGTQPDGCYKFRNQ